MAATRPGVTIEERYQGRTKVVQIAPGLVVINKLERDLQIRQCDTDTYAIVQVPALKRFVGSDACEGNESWHQLVANMLAVIHFILKERQDKFLFENQRYCYHGRRKI